MSFFCLLWVLIIYFLRRGITGGGASGSVWALLLGSITAIIQFFLGYLFSPKGFDAATWIFGFMEIVSMPVLIPLVVCFFMLLFRGFSGDADFANFALLWLIPIAALKALSWSATNDPILLIIVPLLWVAIAMGISFFINLIVSRCHPLLAILSVLCILILPIAAATSYWAFFSQYTLIGFGLLIFTSIPFALSFAIRR